ncbi:hypothetical protein ACJX0J_039721, partial [Zea mays]
LIIWALEMWKKHSMVHSKPQHIKLDFFSKDQDSTFQDMYNHIHNEDLGIGIYSSTIGPLHKSLHIFRFGPLFTLVKEAHKRDVMTGKTKGGGAILRYAEIFVCFMKICGQKKNCACARINWTLLLIEADLFSFSRPITERILTMHIINICKQE